MTKIARDLQKNVENLNFFIYNEKLSRTIILHLTKGRYPVEKKDFLQKLEKLLEFAKTRHNALDAGEINDFFAGDSLNPEQMDQIYTYLEGRGVDVVPVIDESVLNDDAMMLDDLDDSFIKDGDEEEIDIDAVDLLEGIGTEDPVRMYLKDRKSVV